MKVDEKLRISEKYITESIVNICNTKLTSLFKFFYTLFVLISQLYIETAIAKISLLKKGAAPLKTLIDVSKIFHLTFL